MTLFQEPNTCPFCEGTELEPCAIYAGRPVRVCSPAKGTLYFYPGSSLFRCAKCRALLPEGFLICGTEFEKRAKTPIGKK